MPFFRITYKQEIEYSYDLVAVDAEDAGRIADNMGSLIMPTQQDVILKGKTTEVDEVREIEYEQFRETQIDGYPPRREEGSGRTKLLSVEFLDLGAGDTGERVSPGGVI